MRKPEMNVLNRRRKWLWGASVLGAAMALVGLSVLRSGSNGPDPQHGPSGAGGTAQAGGRSHLRHRESGPVPEDLRQLLAGRLDKAAYVRWAKAAVRNDPEEAWRELIGMGSNPRAEYVAPYLLTELAGYDDEALERLITAGEFGDFDVRQLLKLGLGHPHAAKVSLNLWEHNSSLAVRHGLLLALAEYDAHLAREKLASMDPASTDGSLYGAVAKALIREDVTEGIAWASGLEGWQADAVWRGIGSSLAAQLGETRRIESLGPLLEGLPHERQLATFEHFLEGGDSGPQEDFASFWELSEAVRPDDRMAARCMVLAKYGDHIEVVLSHVNLGELGNAELIELSESFASSSPSLAFAWAQNIDDTSPSEQASAAVLRTWLAKDSEAAGAAVLELEAGRARDFLAGEVVHYLASKDSYEEARDWIQYIADGALRDQLSELIER